jgi:hypothetical protein
MRGDRESGGDREWASGGASERQTDRDTRTDCRIVTSLARARAHTHTHTHTRARASMRLEKSVEFRLKRLGFKA